MTECQTKYPELNDENYLYVLQKQFIDMIKNNLDVYKKLESLNKEEQKINVNRLTNSTATLVSFIPYALMNKKLLEHVRSEIASSSDKFSLMDLLLRGYVAFNGLPNSSKYLKAENVVSSIPVGHGDISSPTRQYSSLLLSQDNHDRLFYYDAVKVTEELNKDKFTVYVFSLILGINSYTTSVMDFLE